MWEMKDGIWRGTVKAPEVAITKGRYWAIYDPQFHEFIITGKEKSGVYDIEWRETHSPSSQKQTLR